MRKPVEELVFMLSLGIPFCMSKQQFKKFAYAAYRQGLFKQMYAYGEVVFVPKETFEFTLWCKYQNKPLTEYVWMHHKSTPSKKIKEDENEKTYSFNAN